MHPFLHRTLHRTPVAAPAGVAALVAVLALVATLASPAAAVAATRRAATVPSLVPRVVTCSHRAVVRPRSFVVTCADANERFTGIRWTSWRAGAATGVATYVHNTCRPSCAAGRFVTSAASLMLSGSRRTRLGLLYTTLRWTYRERGHAVHASFRLLA